MTIVILKWNYKGMNNFYKEITPIEAKELGDKRSIKELTRLAKQKGKCGVCEQEAWRYADTGLCFTCTTGEADASEDYELKEI